jgi:hypothetical protein
MTGAFTNNGHAGHPSVGCADVADIRTILAGQSVELPGIEPAAEIKLTCGNSEQGYANDVNVPGMTCDTRRVLMPSTRLATYEAYIRNPSARSDPVTIGAGRRSVANRRTCHPTGIAISTIVAKCQKPVAPCQDRRGAHRASLEQHKFGIGLDSQRSPSPICGSFTIHNT